LHLKSAISVRRGGERLKERMQGMKEFSLFSSHTVTFPILDSKNTLKQRRVEAVLRIRFRDPVLFDPWIRNKFFPDPKAIFLTSNNFLG
jgi:hypothetical protein